MSCPPPSEATTTIVAAARQRRDLRTTLTTLRRHAQFLHRVACQQDGGAWQRQAAGLAVMDQDISTLLCQLDQIDAG